MLFGKNKSKALFGEVVKVFANAVPKSFHSGILFPAGNDAIQ